MDIEIKGGLSMSHNTTQSDWRTVRLKKLYINHKRSSMSFRSYWI